MAELKVSGRVVKVYPINQVNDKLKKRQLVIEEDNNPKYPQIVVFDFINDKCSLLDPLKVNDRVTVDFNFSGRAYQKPGEDTKYFSGVQGWKLNIDSAGASNGGQSGYTAAQAPDLTDDENSPF